MDLERREWVEELAERHGRMVLGAAQRVLGRVEDAEDVLQGVFLRLLNGTMSRDSARDWGAMLRVMATHAAIDSLRRRPRGVLESEDALAGVADAAPLAPELLERRRLADALRAALAQLPPSEAEAFALRHFEDFTYGEIARRSGRTANQVGVMLHRTRAKLREILEPVWAPTVAQKE